MYVFRTSVINRSTAGQYASSIHSRTSTPRIVVSVDRRRPDSNEHFKHHQRTSTPVRPSPHHQINMDGLPDEYHDSYSVHSIPKETYEILSRFPEFRRLVKAYNSEKKKCLIWAQDLILLQKSYKQLEENSFRIIFLFFFFYRYFSVLLARPPAVALSYLVDSVTQIQQSSGRGDPRTDEQLACDIGENLMFLVGLKDVIPQQTALNLFNHLYPGYEAKVKLGSVNKLEVTRPGLLETILGK